MFSDTPLIVAILFAAILTSAICLAQWFSLLGGSNQLNHLVRIVDLGSRTPGNFVQENHAATFMLWGIVSACWFRYRGNFGITTLLTCCLFLALGVGFTNSRTTVLALILILILAAAIVWRLPIKFAPTIWSLLSALIIVLVVFILSPSIGDALQFGNATSEWYERPAMRPAIWQLFVGSALERPWIGWGINNFNAAQLEVADFFPSFGGVAFSSSHNLFLDLVVMAGLPVGLFLSVCLTFWFVSRVIRINSERDLILLMFVVPVATHAVLEYPLQYAYFLLPVGVVIGMIERHQKQPPLFRLGRPVFGGLLLILFVSGALVIRDYASVKRGAYEMLMEDDSAKMSWMSFSESQDVLILDSLASILWALNWTPASEASSVEIDLIRKVAVYYPAPAIVWKLIYLEASQNNAAEVTRWMTLSRLFFSHAQYRALKSRWEDAAAGNPRIASFPWLDGPTTEQR